MLKEKIYIASDHAGILLKSAIVQHLQNSADVEIIDLGPQSDDRVDYPDFAALVAKEVSTNQECRGILVCGSGIGVSIVANKFAGVRAALCTSVQLAKLSRQHNDANILCLGERILKEKNALMMVDTWLKTEFEAGRHADRVQKIHSTTGC
jgi:ribose 5-phosphate isomerase B